MDDNSRTTVKPFYKPPHLLVKQAVTIMLYAWLTGWNRRAFLRWAVQLKNISMQVRALNRFAASG